MILKFYRITRFSIILLLVFALAMPLAMPLAMATGLAQDDILNVFGNANMDGTIDEKDIAYVESIIKGTSESTRLADVNHDGIINALDLDQIEKILRGDVRELTVTDSLGRNVTVAMPVQRLVALGSYRNEAIKILKAEDKIAGVSSDIKNLKYYYPELVDMPEVGTWSAPDAEAIVKLRPDIVITSANHDRVSQLRRSLESTGIAVLGLDFYRDSLIAPEMRMLGYILGKRAESDRYLQWRKGYEKTIAGFASNIKEDDRPRVFLEWGTGKSVSELQSYGKGGSGDYACTFAGGRNIAGHLAEYPKVDSEWVITEDPDVIIKFMAAGSGSAGWNDTESTSEILKDIVDSRSGWSNLEAVKNNRFHIISNEIVWGPDSIVGGALIARWINPGLEIDPKKIYIEYLEEFMGLEYPEKIVLGYPDE